MPEFGVQELVEHDMPIHSIPIYSNRPVGVNSQTVILIKKPIKLVVDGRIASFHSH